MGGHLYSCTDDTSVLVSDVRREHGEHMLWVYPYDASVERLVDWYESHDAAPIMSVSESSVSQSGQSSSVHVWFSM